MAKLVKLGGSQVDLSKVCRDLRGVEHLVEEAVREDWQENRFVQFDERVYPFPDAADIREWDSFFLGRFPPMYNNIQGTCADCPLGPCNLEAILGRCGLTLGDYQARLSLRRACRGSMTQFQDSREVLNYALKLFGPQQPVSMGKGYERSDYTAIGVLTGQYVRSLQDLEIALSYAEAQLTKLFTASFTATGNPLEIEAMALHAGSILFLAMDVAEIVKMSLFGFTNAADQALTELLDYPPATTRAGLGNIDRSKPVLAFLGDSFLTAWLAIDYLKKHNLADGVEICGVGSVGHDIARFYDKVKVLAPMAQARKVLRTGLFDLVVASTSCLPTDILGELKRTDTRLIWTSAGGLGVPDRTDADKEAIIRELQQGPAAIAIRDLEKAAEVAVRAVGGIKRRASYFLPLEKARAEAKKCREDCDICFRVCPNSLLIGSGLRALPKDGYSAMAAVEDGCFFCGRCQEVCPEGIPVMDIIVGALGEKIPQDKWVMRAGRGPTSRQETTGFAFGAMWGNCPGMLFILGCGDAKYRQDLGWITYELVARNCIVWTAGCAGGEVGRYFNQAEGKFLYEQFTAEAQPRNLMNCGGCSACGHLADMSQKYARSGSAISHYANFAETAERVYTLWIPVMIFWGVLPDRAYALAAGFARLGVVVVMGPASGFGFQRWCVGNKWDWQNWWELETFGGKKRVVEPAPKHLIIPVETKEEAVTLAVSELMRPTDLRDARQIRLESYCEFHDKFFGGFPDDLHLFISSDWELPMRYKGGILKWLAEKKGWEVERIRIKRARHPDGRLLTMEELDREYSARTRHVTKLPRLIAKPVAVPEAKP